MKVKMLLKSGFGSIRHGDVVDAAPDDVRLGLQLGFLAPADAEAAALASRERKRPEESALDVYLATVFGLAAAWAEDYAFLQGDGVAKPQGIVNSPASATVTRATGNLIQYADVSGMVAKLAPSSYDRAFWVHSPSAVPQLLQLKDGTARAVLLGAGLATGVWPRRRNWSLLGFPMYCSEKLPPLGTKGDLILIDPRYYLIGDRMQATLAVSDHVNFLKNQVTFRLTRRCDGQPWIEKPITLQDGATTVSPFVVLN